MDLRHMHGHSIQACKCILRQAHWFHDNHHNPCNHKQLIPNRCLQKIKKCIAGQITKNLFIATVSQLKLFLHIWAGTGIDAPPGPRTARCDLMRDRPALVRGPLSWNATFCTSRMTARSIRIASTDLYFQTEGWMVSVVDRSHMKVLTP